MTEALRHVTFDRLHNFRDFGGYPAAGGRRVRWGRLYRSDSLGKLRGDDLARFSALGLRTVIDLRYPWEADAGGRVPAAFGLAYHSCSIEHRDQPGAAGRRGSGQRAAGDPLRLGQGPDRPGGGAGPVAARSGRGRHRRGSVRQYVTGYLGVSDAVISEIRALYLN
jgi:protein-tyrosine phosphatase